MNKYVQRFIAVVLIGLMIFMFASCASVDSTEHCVETRFGEVTKERVATGPEATFFTDITCFPLTEQNFPDSRDEEGRPMAERINGQNADKLTVDFDMAATWTYAPGTVTQTFEAKRNPEAAEIEVHNAFREGSRSALAAWSTNRLLAERENFDDAVAAAVQKELGARYQVTGVTIRGVVLPPQIEEAQLAAVQAERDQITAMATFKKDSVTAFTREYQARVDAEIKRLQGQSYSASPQLLQLEIERERASAVKNACWRATTCILGVEVVSGVTGPR